MKKTEGAGVQQRFDQAAATWDANPGRVALARGVVEAIRRAVPLHPAMQAMDFGAGTGLVTLGLLPYVGTITAVDASREMLKILETKVQTLRSHQVRTFWRELADSSWPETRFDLIASSMVLHHIADVPQLFPQLRARLAPGGWIALADLDAEDGSFHADPTGVYHHGFDRAEVCGWLSDAGFAEAAAREAYRVVRSSDNGPAREYPVFLATARAD